MDGSGRTRISLETEEYFDNRADADCDETGFIPNEEMKLLTTVRAALSKAGGTAMSDNRTKSPSDAAFEAAWDCAKGIDYDELRSLIDIALNAYHKALPDAVHVVFDSLPSPDGAMFVEVETPDGHSIKIGEWVQRDDTTAALIIPIGARP